MKPERQNSEANASLRTLITRERWIEIGRIFFVALLTFVYWQKFLPLRVLLGAVAVLSGSAAGPFLYTLF